VVADYYSALVDEKRLCCAKASPTTVCILMREGYARITPVAAAAIQQVLR
jgi:hypothetical protein